MPLASSTNAPNVVVLTTLAAGNSSPTSTSLSHRADALGQLLAELAVGRVDQDLTLVVDVDLGLELLGQAADGLAALADQQADLRRVDLDLDDPRGVLRQLARAARR